MSFGSFVNAFIKTEMFMEFESFFIKDNLNDSDFEKLFTINMMN